MTDRPEKAKWLKEDERNWLVGVMNHEAAGRASATKHGIVSGLANPRVLALSLIYFGTSAGLYTLGIWAPQIIRQLGVSSMTVGLLNAIPPIVSVVAMVFWSRHSDRTGERKWHVALACMAATVGLLVAAISNSVVGLIASLTLVNIGISCAKPPLWTMPTTFLSGAAAATGIATINSIGNLGGFFGPAMIGWIKDQTGSFAGGLYFVAGLLVLSGLLTLLLARSQTSTVTPGNAAAH
jgi:ACS family tartrate transporter-like MFS transporter